MSLFNELKRRNVFRVAIGYIVSSWLLAQVADLVLENIGAPDWIMQTILLLVALGFPIVVFFSWVYEATSEGIKRQSEVDQSQSITHVTGRKLDRAIIGVLVIALAYFILDKYVLKGEESSDLSHTTPIAESNQAVENEEAVSASETTEIHENSIVVLPFVNMSSDPEQEYFSDGITEELLNLLAKIPELQVISRTSAFYYKGKDIRISDLAKELKVAHVLEGSVRKSGNQARITAQLIRADSDTHLWSETYDRTLDDIFAIQDEIAATVVEQLQINLLGDTPTVEHTDPEAYALYLKALQVYSKGTLESLPQTYDLLSQVLKIDPRFASAWAKISLVYLYDPEATGLNTFNDSFEMARETAEKALSLDPENALAHLALAMVANMVDNNLEVAAQHVSQARKIEPTSSDVLVGVRDLLNALGRSKEAILLSKRIVQADPLNPAAYLDLGYTYMANGQPELAKTTYQNTLTLAPENLWANRGLVNALIVIGDLKSALKIAETQKDDGFRLEGLAMVHHILGNAAESDAALTELISNHARLYALNIARVLAQRAEVDGAFEWLQKSVEYKDNGVPGISWDQKFEVLHDDPRWLQLLESIGRSPEQLAAVQFDTVMPR